MTGYKSKRAAAQDKLNDDDDIQVYKRPWVGLTEEQREECTQSPFTEDNYDEIEAKLKEKNT